MSIPIIKNLLTTYISVMSSMYAATVRISTLLSVREVLWHFGSRTVFMVK